MITLTEGEYATGDALAAEIESRINADARVVVGRRIGIGRLRCDDAPIHGHVGDERFDVGGCVHQRVGRRGDERSASLSAPAPPGRDAGDRGRSRRAEYRCRSRGGALGDRGTVTLVRGVMNRIDQALNNALSFGGLFANKQTSLEAQAKELEDQKTAFDARMTALQTRLQTQFAAADALISQLNSTSTFLSQQLSALREQRNK